MNKEYKKYLKDNKELVELQIKSQNQDWYENINEYNINRRKKGLNNTRTGLFFLRELTEGYVKTFENFLVPSDRSILKAFANLTNKNGKKYMDLESIIYIALKSILDIEFTQKPQNSLSLKISTDLILELKKRILDEEQPAWMYSVNKSTRTLNQHYRNRQIHTTIKYFRNKGIEFKNEILDLDKTEAIRLGALVLNLIVRNSSYFQFEIIRRKKRRLKIVKFTQDFFEVIKQVDEKFSKLDPKYRAMVIKPVPHSDIIGSGFLTNETIEDLKLNNIENLKSLFIRTNNKEQLFRNRGSDIKDIYKAVNIIQETPYTINKDMLDLFNYFTDNDIEIRNKHDKIIFYKHELKSLPDKSKVDFENIVEKNEYKKLAHEIYQFNSDFVSEKSTQIIKLNLANEYINLEEFYFNHNLDWRGRVYPLAVLLQHQGDMLAKSLLMSNNKLPIEETGITALFRHCASVYGNDKLHPVDKEDWVIDNLDLIRKIGKNPINSVDYWRETDKPFLFVAACIEINKMYQFKEAGNQIELFETSLFCSIDATNSGNQWYAGLLRCPITGKSTNLTYEEKIQDIYQEVADQLIIDLGNVKEKKRNKETGFLESNEDFEYAKMWLDFGINRSICKSPTMTFVYSSGLFGQSKQIREYLREVNADDKYFTKKSIPFFAKKMMSAVKKVSTSSREAMDFFKSYTKVLSKNNIEVVYKNHMNFYIYNTYKKTYLKEVRTYFGSVKLNKQLNTKRKLLSNRVTENTDEINVIKSVNSISANIIHSLDSTLVLKTALACEKEGITDLMIIHDSFGTLAPQVERMSEIIREEFIKIHKETDFIKDFREQMIELVYQSKSKNKEEILKELDLIKIPEKGTLNIDEVKDSLYFVN